MVAALTANVVDNPATAAAVVFVFPLDVAAFVFPAGVAVVFVFQSVVSGGFEIPAEAVAVSVFPAVVAVAFSVQDVAAVVFLFPAVAAVVFAFLVVAAVVFAFPAVSAAFATAGASASVDLLPLSHQLFSSAEAMLQLLSQLLLSAGAAPRLFRPLVTGNSWLLAILPLPFAAASASMSQTVAEI